MPSALRGQFYRLYMTIDVFSRLITGWEVHLDESAQHAAILIDKACLKHRVSKDRPSVGDHNPYSEALFRMLKYTPAYPAKPFMRPPSRLSMRYKNHSARNWKPVEEVWLNPAKEHDIPHENIRLVA
ncbi:hypothetical protein MJ863_04100 [Alcaligenes ammonioxydans]|nr:hypothetical protein [Alcaligenes ammonioxydans]